MIKFEGLRANFASWWTGFKRNSSSPPSSGMLVLYLTLIGYCNFLVWDISEEAQRCDLNKIELKIENLDRKQGLVELKLDSLILASRFGKNVAHDQEYWDETEKNLKIISDTNVEIHKTEKSYASLCDEADGIYRETLVLFLVVTFVFGLMTVLPFRKVERKNRKKNV